MTVTVTDAQGNPVAGATVVLSVTGSANTITQPAVSDGAGVTTGSFTTTVAETKTVSATAGGVGLAATVTVGIPDFYLAANG